MKKEAAGIAKNHMHKFKQVGRWRKYDHHQCEIKNCTAERWSYRGNPVVVNIQQDIDYEYKTLRRPSA